jgi:hypothetical protein
MFERAHEIVLMRHVWPHIPIEKRCCTVAQCRVQTMPGSLEQAGKVLGIVNGKDAAAGRRLINKICVPQNWAAMKKRGADPVFIDPKDDPKAFAELIGYNRQDVIAEREVDARVPPLSPFEQRVWQVDARVHDRGMATARWDHFAASTVARVGGLHRRPDPAVQIRVASEEQQDRGVLDGAGGRRDASDHLPGSGNRRRTAHSVHAPG